MKTPLHIWAASEREADAAIKRHTEMHGAPDLAIVHLSGCRCYMCVQGENKQHGFILHPLTGLPL